MIDECIAELKSSFESLKNDQLATEMAAYMKNHFPFLGIQSKNRKDAQKYWIHSLKKETDKTIRWKIIRALFEQKEREFHYVAIDYLNSWPKKFYSSSDATELEWILTHQTWWDSVDTIASNYLGKWAHQFPKESRNLFEKWRKTDHFWLHRSCLIYQLKYKDAVDIPYLESCIAQFYPNNQFFIQKAIGWSLRELSKRFPEETVRILTNYPITGLAKREASKYL